MLISLYAYLDKHTPFVVTIIHFIPRDVKSNKLIIYQMLMEFIVWFIWWGGGKGGIIEKETLFL